MSARWASGLFFVYGIQTYTRERSQTKIVDRRTYRVKFGQGTQAAEWLKEQIDGNTFYTETYRIYSPDIGVEYDEVVVEWEYEDVPAMRAAWKAWWARPSTEEAIPKWSELAAPGGHTEIWQLFAKR